MLAFLFITGCATTGDQAAPREDLPAEQQITVTEGARDKTAVLEVIRAKLAGVMWCYREALNAKQAVPRKAWLRFTVEPDGTVVSPAVDSTEPRAGELDACIEAEVVGWRYPASDAKATRVSYPLLLNR